MSSARVNLISACGQAFLSVLFFSPLLTLRDRGKKGVESPV